MKSQGILTREETMPTVEEPLRAFPRTRPCYDLPGGPGEAKLGPAWTLPEKALQESRVW